MEELSIDEAAHDLRSTGLSTLPFVELMKNLTEYVTVDGKEESMCNFDLNSDLFGVERFTTRPITGGCFIRDSSGREMYEGEVIMIFWTTVDGVEKVALVPEGHGQTFDPNRLRAGYFKLGNLHNPTYDDWRQRSIVGRERRLDPVTRATIVNVEGTFLDGLLHGKDCREFFPVGNVKFVGSYLEGVRNGYGREFFPSGKKRAEGIWADGSFDVQATREHKAQEKKQIIAEAKKKAEEEAKRAGAEELLKCARKRTIDEVESLVKLHNQLDGAPKLKIVRRDANESACPACMQEVSIASGMAAYVACGHVLCKGCAELSASTKWATTCMTCKAQGNRLQRLF
jgi:hypothetical protein